MMYYEPLEVRTAGFCDILDITAEVAAIAARSGVGDGLATVFVCGSTAAVTTIEFESGAVSDLKRALEHLAPEKDHYEHNQRWGDGNGFSHVRAALLKPSLSIPLIEGRLALGTWQQVVLMDFDNKRRTRKVLVHIIG